MCTQLFGNSQSAHDSISSWRNYGGIWFPFFLFKFLLVLRKKKKKRFLETQLQLLMGKIEDKVLLVAKRGRWEVVSGGSCSNYIYL